MTLFRPAVVGGGAATIANVATGGGGSNTATTGNITSTNGSTFVVAVADSDTGGFNTPTDSKSNTYTLIGTTTEGGQSMAIYSCVGGTGGATHNATATTTAGVGLVSVLLVEIADAASIDTSSFGKATDAASPWTATSGSFSQANNLALAFIMGTGSGGNPCTFAESTGFTVHANAVTDGNSNFPLAMAYKQLAATTAVTPSFTTTAGSLSDCTIHIVGVVPS